MESNMRLIQYTMDNPIELNKINIINGFDAVTLPDNLILTNDKIDALVSNSDACRRTAEADEWLQDTKPTLIESILYVMIHELADRGQEYSQKDHFSQGLQRYKAMDYSIFKYNFSGYVTADSSAFIIAKPMHLTRAQCIIGFIGKRSTLQQTVNELGVTLNPAVSEPVLYEGPTPCVCGEGGCDSDFVLSNEQDAYGTVIKTFRNILGRLKRFKIK